MANPTPEELQLRRRARRRLIGAIAIALFAIVVLPMVFEPEPKPLGTEVDIRIPDQATPFPPQNEAASVLPPPQAAPEPEPSAAAPAVTSEPVPAETAPKAAENPAPKPETQPPAAKPAKVAEAPAEPKKVEPKPKDTKPAESDRGYYLQLGVFSSEANARQMAAKVEDAGFKARVMRIDGQHRVRLGPLADREQALETQRKLKTKGFSTVIVAP